MISLVKHSTGPKSKNERWKDHFKSLLNNDTTNLPINFNPPTRSETQTNIDSLKRNKLAILDSDGITPEALKDGGVELDNITHAFCVEVYDGLVPLNQWITNLIIPVPKKGDPSLITNYRGISLTSVAAKVYNRFLPNRLRPIVDPVLRHNQAGFRTGRSCIQQINTLRRLIEGFRSNQLPLVITFVDFQEAFDSINRNLMFAILRHYGIPDITVRAIRVLYDSQSAVYVNVN